jgi:hypothetical protein
MVAGFFASSQVACGTFGRPGRPQIDSNSINNNYSDATMRHVMKNRTISIVSGARPYQSGPNRFDNIVYQIVCYYVLIAKNFRERWKFFETTIDLRSL